MAVKVMSWVWDYSRSRAGERLVLLAIADCADANGTNAYPTMTELARKTGMCERAVRDAVRRLAKLGEIVIEQSHGRRANLYRIVMNPEETAESNPAETAGIEDTQPGGNCRDNPEDSAGSELDPTRQFATPNPAVCDTQPGSLMSRTKEEPSRTVRNRKAPTVPADEPRRELVPAAHEPTVNERAQALASAYHEAEPMSRYPAILVIAKRAIQSGRYTDQQIRAALLRLAAEGRSVTVETLRIELDGLPPSRASPNGRSTTDERVAGTLALARRYEEDDHEPG